MEIRVLNYFFAVGFDKKSAEVRIAQYGSGTRAPKQALVKKTAEVFDVNPRFLSDDEILGAEGDIMMLFGLDEHYPTSMRTARTKTTITARAYASALS